MKRCPTCQQVYPEDAPEYCPRDGQRLVREDAAAFDPEQTVTASGGHLDPVAPPAEPSSFEPQPRELPPKVQMHTPLPVHEARLPVPEQVAPQFQQGWPPAPFQPSPDPAGGVRPDRMSPPQYGMLPAQIGGGGRRKAFAIGSLVLGVDVATFMAVTIIRDPNFTYILMLILSSLGILLGISALFLVIKRPVRFGGVEMAIVGLALCVAGLVYFLLNQG